jgi:hypothetical protein
MTFESSVKTVKADKKTERIQNAVVTFAPVLYPQDWWLGKTARMRLWPTVGGEGGWNLKNPNEQLDGKSILRLKTGGRFYLVFPINRPFLKEIAFEGSLEYRHLFRDEARIDTQKIKLAAGPYVGPDGSTIDLPAGTLAARKVFITDQGARRYWTATARVGLTPNLQVVSQYSKGSLPPAFEHVDKWETGIAFRFNFLGQ